MTRQFSGNRSGTRLHADRSVFPPALGRGVSIAVLSAPFGAGTSYATVGDVPGQLALAGAAVVAGATTSSDGATYSLKVRATSADGRREAAETLSFACRSTAPMAVLAVIGDSNARGSAIDESSLAYVADAQVVTWNGTAFVPYAPGTRTGCTVPGAAAGSETRVGPEMQFARAFRAANPVLPIAIVKYARAGSYQGFGTDAPVNGDATNSWDPTSGSLLAGARAQLQAAMAALVQAGYSPTVSAVIEVSGTNDASDATLASGVQATKTAALAAIRASWPVGPSTMFLVQRVKADSPQPNLAAVRAAQAAVANAAPDVVLVDTDGMEANPGDATHFDMAGQIADGNAHYAAWSGRMNRRAVALGGKLLFLADAAAPGTLTMGAAPAVAAWASVTGGRTIAQTAAGKQPVLLASAVAGRPALDFDGSDDGLSFIGSNGFGSGDREGFAIVNSDALAANTTPGTLYARGGGTDPTDLRLSRTVVGGVSRFRMRVGIGGGSAYQVVADQIVAEGGPFVLHWRISGTSVYLSVNGQPEQSASLTAAPAIGDGSLYVGQANASQYFDGRIRLVGETSALTAADRAALLADLKAEAGL